MKYLTLILLFALAGSVNASNQGDSDLAPLLLLNPDMSTWPLDNPNLDPSGFIVYSSSSDEVGGCDLTRYYCSWIGSSPQAQQNYRQWTNEAHHLYFTHVYRCNTWNSQSDCDELSWYEEQRAIQAAEGTTP